LRSFGGSTPPQDDKSKRPAFRGRRLIAAAFFLPNSATAKPVILRPQQQQTLHATETAAEGSPDWWRDIAAARASLPFHESGGSFGRFTSRSK
jgi:hypothetical protein